jgi:hypothetical protein
VHCLVCSNLTLLTSAGVQLVPFSPIRDGRLPPGLSGVLLGGGPAHRWAHHLAANGPMLAALRAFAAAGGLVWAEGSGMVYVSQSLTTGMQQHVLGEWLQLFIRPDGSLLSVPMCSDTQHVVTHCLLSHLLWHCLRHLYRCGMHAAVC